MLQSQQEERYDRIKDATNMIKPPPSLTTHSSLLRDTLTGESYMHSHHTRWQICLHCHKEFNDASNHARACTFHPGNYRPACPKSCTGRTVECLSHFLPRWSCCDSLDEVNLDVFLHSIVFSCTFFFFIF